ncbi:MAG: toll/interleukin-1 receptor domain-containing protein [Kineosporiaceae bacterium]|nr:toll/interleukin-1 receptor domain-containing protein [Kineosporiaceae bacterium]
MAITDVDPLVFVSYRRSDAAGHARALYRDLCRRFDKDRIFFDRESLEAGSVFPERLREGIQSCRVFLALIGPDWLDARSADGGRRLDREDDVVRQELATALDLGKAIIPVTFDDTPVPPASDLPPPLRALVDHDVLMLRGKNLEYDTQLDELVRLLTRVPGMPRPSPPEQGVLVGAGLDFDVYRRGRYVPIRPRVPLRAAFKPLIEDRTQIFTGRRDVFRRIMEFAARRDGGYLVVTAPPGFGKTSLVANLVAATPEAFAYHFFAPVYGAETLDETFFLQNVVQQMSAWDDAAQEVPDSLNELRALYQQLVETPREHSQVLVLDGLDEVGSWRLAPYLSRRLPPNLHIIVTVRDVGQDWRADYEFPRDQVTPLPLGGLDREEVRELFAGLGTPDDGVIIDDDLLTEVMSRAAHEDDPRLGADPFYVRFLAEDVAAGRITPRDVAHQPHGLDAYLDRWWQQIRQLAGDTPIRDLFGTLAAAVRPMSRAELEAVNPSLLDDWSGDFFDQVLERVRRMVRRHEDGRYSLVHPRLRRYIADPRRIGKISDYRGRLLAYCEGWPQHRSPYALTALGAHLLEAGRLDDLYRLHSAEWIAAHWSVLGTYAALVRDLDAAAKALLGVPEADHARIAAFVVARQTARELMLSFPEELFTAWVADGDVDRALACLREVSSARGHAVGVLTAVATAILDQGNDHDGRADHAGELALRAADEIRLIRMTNQQYGALVDLVELLPVDRGLPEAARGRLLAMVDEFIRQAPDDVLRAASLGALASALSSSTPDLARARDLTDQARAAAATIQSPADRAYVCRALLPALEALTPDAVLSELELLVDHGAAVLRHGSLMKNPFFRLLDRWRPQAGPDQDRAARLLLRAAQLCLAESEDYLGAALTSIVPHLIRLGRSPEALALLDSGLQFDQVEGTRAICASVVELREVAADQLPQWLALAVEATDPSFHEMPINRELFTEVVVGALARTGDWDAAVDLMRTVRPRELARVALGLLRLIATTDGPDTAAREARMDRVAAVVEEFGEQIPSDDRARVAAVWAQAAEPARATRELARASALCLAHLPEGDCDVLRRIQVAALHQSGAHQHIAGVLRAMTWVTTVSAATAALVQSDDVAAADRSRCALALLEELSARRGAPLYGEALRTAAPLVARVAPDDPVLADQLAQLLLAGTDDVPGGDERLMVATTVAAGLVGVEVDRGARALAGVLGWIRALQAQGFRPSVHTVELVADQLASVVGALGERSTPLEEELAAVVDVVGADDVVDSFTARAAQCRVLAQHDITATLVTLERMVPEIADLAEVSSPALYLTRMIADLTGRRVGANEVQARAVRVLADTTARCAHRSADEAFRVLELIVDQAVSILSPLDRAQALVAVSSSLPLGPAAWSPRWPDLVIGALQRASFEDPGLRSTVLEAGVEALCAVADPETAERLAEREEDEVALDLLRNQVMIARERAELGRLTVFEEACVAGGNGQLAGAVLHSVRVEDDADGVLRALSELLVHEQTGVRRARLLSDFVPAVAAPLFALGGTPALDQIIIEIERFDRAFVDAAWLIGPPVTSAGSG